LLPLGGSERSERGGPSVTTWVSDLSHALANGEPAVIVTVAHAAGSTPREAGATMVVESGGFHGSIGGGHLEFEALGMARDALSNATTPTATWIVRFPLAARLGQCCGGVATLAFSKFSGGPHAWLDAATVCVRTSTPFALVTRVGGARDAPAKLLVTLDDTHGSLAGGPLESEAISAARARLAAGQVGAALVGSPAADGVVLLIDIVRPDAFPVLVFGNGHVGRALVQALGVLPAHVRWIDSRDADFPGTVPANCDIVATDAPEVELTQAPHGAFIVVVTHSHALDFTLVEAALARGDWRYLGLIGSRTKRAQLERRLSARGMPAEALARVICPIGMRSGIAIRSKEPGAIAIAVAAELLGALEASAMAAGGAFQRRSNEKEMRNKARS
jgi:xanthine dehydrogenase accessory factor